MMPDHEQVGLFMRFWIEVKNTPTEVLVGFITLMIAFLKLLGKVANRRVELNPNVTRNEMEECKDDIMNHMDTNTKDTNKRIDDLYKELIKK